MPSKKALLKSSRLYLILDAQVNTYEELFEITKTSLSCGVDIVQLRDKIHSSKIIFEFCCRLARLIRNRMLFIVNDRVDIALASGAHGVHLGQEDLPVERARKILGPQGIIGVSCQTIGHIRRAHSQKADYIGLGSVYKTQTKPGRDPLNRNLLQEALELSRIPIFAIGGVTLKNYSQLKASGVKRVAICRNVCQAKDTKKILFSWRNQLKD